MSVYFRFFVGRGALSVECGAPRKKAGDGRSVVMPGG